MSATPALDAPLPAVRRVVTGHTPEGKAVFLEDAETPSEPLRAVAPGEPPATRFTHLFRTDESPAEAGVAFVDVIKEKSAELVSTGGSTLRAVDMPPHSISPFHRTVSLDYAIVAKGKVVCQLDDDVRKTISEGDVLVQRGTIHAWHNETDEWARVYFVMLPSRPVDINGKLLETEFRS